MLKTTSQKLTVATLVIVAAAVLGFVLFRPSTPEAAASGPVDYRLDNQPMIGDPDAPATIIAFEDFKCPVCKNFEETAYPRIVAELVETGKAKMYFVNFQFIGPDSVTAGIAGECAYRQDEAAFWNYKAIVYRAQGPENQQWATPSRLVELAGFEGNLDTEALQACIEERRYEEEVLQDREIAQQAGATGTPTIIVNGERLESWDFETVRAAVEAAQP